MQAILVTWTLSSNESHYWTSRSNNRFSSSDNGNDSRASSCGINDTFDHTLGQNASEHTSALGDYVLDYAEGSYYSYSELASPGYIGSEDFAIAQHDTDTGFTTTHNPLNCPHSPIPWSPHPWQEPQQQQTIATTAPLTKSFEAPESRHQCELCQGHFRHQSSLHRHVKEQHKRGVEYWVCTVKGCKKFDKPVLRKDNFKRHCKKRHPGVDLQKFGID